MSAAVVPKPLHGRRALLFAGLVALGLGHALAAIAWSLLVRAMIHRLGAPQQATGWLPGAGSTALGLALATAAMLGLERVLAERLGQSWVNDLRVTVFEHIARTPVREYRRSTGATSLRFVGDMTALRRWAALGLAKLAVAVPMLAGCLVALTLASPLVAATVGVVVLGGFLGIQALTPRLYETSVEARRRRARVAAHVTERVRSRLVMQAYGQEDKERRLLHRRSSRLAGAMVRRARMVGAVRATGEATIMIATGTALVAAFIAGVDAAAAAGALAVIGILTTPLRDLTRVAEYRVGATVSMERLAATLRRPIRPRLDSGEVVEPPEGAGTLSVRNVSVTGVLSRVSVELPGGSTVALVGPNGSGKSSLLTVLAGLLLPDSGQVLLDGVDLRAVDEQELRRMIRLVGPDLPLLRGTVADNIRYAAPDADEEAVAEAIRLSGLDEVLAELPDGPRTRVGEGGTGLSAGQRQRVALARAVLGRPRVLLLDEADAHLDPTAATAVDRLIAGFPGTVVVVTHRPERINSVQMVWRLRGGQVEVGTDGWREQLTAWA
ncbi:hypothetical protein GCM10012275_31300 [Longimycelium tulufanense]|uniref:ABC transporter ATP-binding protein n=1 Tax=Longimycelium tulufanense TaxID=907463 RepID=A0A8J3CF89_9PSEU|nr:ABC transporter ATP-binding protein [Longimycelium tulufanense]GGM57840.1 hypothetical protein GCM10012275_31300 [Longimycelium tulufanense]